MVVATISPVNVVAKKKAIRTTPLYVTKKAAPPETALAKIDGVDSVMNNIKFNLYFRK